MSNAKAIIFIVVIVIYLIRITLLKNECIFFDKLNLLIDSNLILKMRNVKTKLFALIKNEFYIFSLYMTASFFVNNSTFRVVSIITLILTLVFVEFKSFNYNLLCTEYYNNGLLEEIEEAISKLNDEEF